MFNVPDRLSKRSVPLRVAVVGAGLFGTNVIKQVERVSGMVTAIVADIDVEKAKRAYRDAGVTTNIVIDPDDTDLDATIASGSRVVMSDGIDACQPPVDVLVEATGIPDAATRHAWTAIDAGIHVVNATVEADTVVGHILAKLALDRGITYSMAYGDQPALMVELHDWAATIGMDVTAVGRGSMFEEQFRYATPDDVFERYGYSDEYVSRLGLNPQMYNSFLDGTKIAVECCALANATGLPPDVSGMHIPPCEGTDLPDLFRPAEAGGILGQAGVVDAFTSRFPDGGVARTQLGGSIFIVTTTPNETVRSYLTANADHGYHVSQDGTYAAFIRPYHLPGLETPVSIAAAAVRNEPTGTPTDHVAEVVGAAKRPLEPGEVVDGGGGEMIYGCIEVADQAERLDYIPFELLPGATITTSIERDDVLTWDVVTVPDTFIRRLRNDPSAIPVS